MFLAAIKCPKCKVDTKQILMETDLVVDRCEQCHGTWMDKGELSQFVASSSDLPQQQNSLAAGTPANLNCPSCLRSKKTNPLMIIPYATNTKTELKVDFCQSCEGIWLEKAEIGDVKNVLKEMRIAQKKARASG